MTTTDYIHAGDEFADKYGTTIHVIAKTSDGRYQVRYGARSAKVCPQCDTSVRPLGGNRFACVCTGDEHVEAVSALSAGTIRQLYPRRLAVAVVAIVVLAFAGTADAKSVKPATVAKPVATKAFTQYINESEGMAAATQWRIPGKPVLAVACKGPAAQVTCTGTYGYSMGTAHLMMVLAVKGGKAHVVTPPYAPENAPMARTASVSAAAVAAQVLPTLRSQLAQRLKVISYETGHHVTLGTVTLRCVQTPGALLSPWLCAARYAVRAGRGSDTFGEEIAVWPGLRWKSVGSPELVG